MTHRLDDTKGLEYYRASSMSRQNIRSLKRIDATGTKPFKKYPDAVKVTLPRTSWQLAEARLQPLLQQDQNCKSFHCHHL